MNIECIHKIKQAAPCKLLKMGLKFSLPRNINIWYTKMHKKQYIKGLNAIQFQVFYCHALHESIMQRSITVFEQFTQEWNMHSFTHHYHGNVWHLEHEAQGLMCSKLDNWVYALKRGTNVLVASLSEECCLHAIWKLCESLMHQNI